MNELEDEPQDVQLAAPVESEVRRGQHNAIAHKRTDGSAKHTCKKEKPTEAKPDCCEMKRRKRTTQKTVKMFVFGPECDIKRERVYPQCLTKDEYLNFLATPKEFCPTQCAKVEVIRRVRPMSPRIEELAKPMKRRLLRTLEDYGSTLNTEKLDHLIHYIEGETALTPEQAENLIRDKLYSRKLNKKKKKKKPTDCPNKKPSKKSAKVVCEQTIDLEAANCQYTIAQCFVRSILCRVCAHPAKEYRDIAEIILRRLAVVLEYEPIGPEDRKSQQMRLLANVFACWIAEILVELAGTNQAALAEECEKRQVEAEERALMEQELASAADDEEARDADADDDDDDDDSSDDDDAASVPTTVDDDDATLRSEIDLSKIESSTQCDADDIGCQATEQADESLQCDPDDLGCKADEECVEECVDDEQQTECSSKFDAECGTEVDEECSTVRALASRMSVEFDTDVPFITLAKIFDTLYCMIEKESENALCDPLDNRIHRAIYEKLETAVLMENPDLMTPKIRDVIDVNSGKIALWIRRTLDCKDLKVLDDNPAEVESREVRCWSKWVMEVADWGVDQSEWLTKTIGELKDIRRCGKMTRGDWQEYTGKFDKNAMLFRRAYKDAQHQQHHNTMMMTDREVVKTGCKKKLPRYEVESEVCHASGVHEL